LIFFDIHQKKMLKIHTVNMKFRKLKKNNVRNTDET